MKSLQISKLLFIILALSVFTLGIQLSLAGTDEENAQEPCTVDTCGTDEEIEIQDSNGDEPKTEPQPEPACTKDTWTCSDWGVCTDYKYTRTCTLTYDCPGVDTQKPVESGLCEPPPPPEPEPAPVVKPKKAPVTPPPPPPPPVEVSTPPVEAPSNETAPTTDTPPTQTPSSTEPSVSPTQTPETTQGGLIPASEPGTSVEEIYNEQVVQVLSTKMTSFEEAIKEELQTQKDELLNSGVTEEDANRIINRIFIERRAEEKINLVREISEDSFGVTIKDNNQDSNGDGVSDELSVQLGINPNYQPTGEVLTPIDQKIFRTDSTKINLQCSLGVSEGTKLSSKGFTVLSACPLNRNYTLYVKDSSGNEVSLDTQTVGANHKIIFNIEKPFTTGEYFLQVRPTSGEGSSETIKVFIVDESELDLVQPVVRKIEDVSVEAVREIKVYQTKDGRVHVSGIADVSSAVIATFQSAIFNSALLADTRSGAFEIVSSDPLEPGIHNVTVFSTRIEDSVQSAPVKIQFEVIQGRGSAFEKSSKTAITILILLLLGASTYVAMRKMRRPVEAAQTKVDSDTAENVMSAQPLPPESNTSAPSIEQPSEPTAAEQPSVPNNTPSPDEISDSMKTRGDPTQLN